MARLTYGIVAAALAALIAGFFVKTSTLPLILSIGFSAGATVLILIGWGRRLRLEQEHGAPQAEPEPQVEELDFIDIGVEEAEDAEYRRPVRSRPVRSGPRARPRPPKIAADAVVEAPELAYERPARGRTRRRPPKIATDVVVELPEDAELTYELPALEDEPPPPPRRRAASKPAAKPKPQPVAPTPAPPAPRRKAAANRSARVVVVPGRGRYHTHACRFAARGDTVEMTVATARRRGYEACSVCSPDDAAGFMPL